MLDSTLSNVPCAAADLINAKLLDNELFLSLPKIMNDIHQLQGKMSCRGLSDASHKIVDRP